MRFIMETSCDGKFPVVLEGARMAVKRDKDLELILVGDENDMREGYKVPERVQVVGVDCSKAEKDIRFTSIGQAMQLYKDAQGESKIEGIIAPGDTGKTRHASFRILRPLYKNAKPCLPMWFENSVLVDVGAMPDCDKEDLYQFALIGRVFSKNYLNVENPKIALLTNGTEIYKGDKLIKGTREMFDRLCEKGVLPKDFFYENKHGTCYIEGDFEDKLDQGLVLVSGGHLGNVLMKFVEGLNEGGKKIAKKYMDDMMLFEKAFLGCGGAIAAPGVYRSWRNFKRKMSYENYAVSPLMGLGGAGGVGGNVFIGHSKSSPEAICNSVFAAQKYLECNLNECILEEINKFYKP